MAYITGCTAPDLSDLGASLHSRHAMGLIFQARKLPEPPGASRLLSGYVTVVDKAVREYSAARELLLSHLQLNNYDHLYDGLGRFENCIHSIKRGFRFFDALSRNPGSPQLDRTRRRLMQCWEGTLTPIRNSIEHIEADIFNEAAFPPGVAHLLMINHDGDTLDIANHRLTFVDLATALRTLHRAGCELLEALPSP